MAPISAVSAGSDVERRVVPPLIPGAPLTAPTPEVLPAVLAAQAAEGARIAEAWEAWHVAFRVMQRDAGRQIWAITSGLIEDRDPLGPTVEKAVTEARRRALNSWRNWAGMYPIAMTMDCYDVTEAIILGFPWQPFLSAG